MLQQSSEQDGPEPLTRSLTRLLDNLPGMVYRCRNDRAWTMEFVSGGCLELTGYQPADLVGSRGVLYADIIHPADRERVWNEVQAALQQRARFQVTYRIHTADGIEKWVSEQGRGVPTPDGRSAVIAGFITEATTQIEVQQRLETQVSEHNRELSTLLEISRNVAATLDLERLLGLVLDELRAAVDYRGAGVLIIEDGVLVQAAGRGPIQERLAEGIRLPLTESGFIPSILERGTPLLIDDVWGNSAIAREYRRTTGEGWLRARPYIRSWGGVPLQVGDRDLGLLVVAHSEANHFSEQHVRVLTAVAAQASVAIENARLVSAAREAAALEERQRLARDLHDAVTQTLFSASLVGDVLPALWARDPKRGEEALEDLRILTRGALAEMRTLLFELRPSALMEAPLGELLRHLADAITGRTRMPITVTIEDFQALPPDIQIAFYRIAQEALNNVVKHAEASHAELHLAGAVDGSIQLRIHDNGRGFKREQMSAGHFGMETMRERATAAGAALTVTSLPEGGTDVLVVWPGLQAPSDADAGMKET